MFLDPDIADMVARGLILSVLGMIWVIILSRAVGLRSFSKMTTVDFVMTVAMGSLMAGASQSADWIGFGQSLTGMAGLFAAQFGFARARSVSDRLEEAIQNTPVMLMRNGLFDDAALRETRVAKSDLIAKLREANVLDPTEVRAVVLETTGDISVLHGDRLDPSLLEGVRRVGVQGSARA